MTKRVQLFAPWLLGFFLVANVHLLPSFERALLATDALGAMLGLWLLWRFAAKGLRVVPFVALFALSVVPLFWGLYAFFDNDAWTTVLSVRWLLAVPWGYALFVVARDPQHRASLVWGLWWGCVINVVVLLLQFYGLVQLTQDIGLAARESALTAIGLDTDRAPGMHYHPNASAAVVSLIVPLSLYLYYARNTRIWVLAVGLGVLLAGTQFTLTRSALLVSLVTILVISTTNRDLKPSLRLVALLVLSGLPALYWIGPPGGWQRWLNPENIQGNSGTRLSSSAEAFWLALENPLGTGNEAGQEALQSAGFAATHNAFLQVAVAYGLLLAVALASLMFILALQVLVGPRTGWRLEAMLALQLLGLFFWEEHLNNPSFIVLACWIVAASVTQISSASRRGSVERPDPAERRSIGSRPRDFGFQLPRSASRKA